MVMVWELLEDNLKKKLVEGKYWSRIKQIYFRMTDGILYSTKCPSCRVLGCADAASSPLTVKVSGLSYKWHLESKGVAVTGDGFVPVNLPSIPKLPDSAGQRLDAFKWSNVNIWPKGTWNSSILHRLVQNCKILWFKYSWFCNCLNKIFFLNIWRSHTSTILEKLKFLWFLV